MWRVDSLEKTLMLGKIEGGKRRDNREWEGWMASWTWWTWAWVSSRSWWWTGKPGVLQYMGSQRVGHNWATELNWLHLKISPWIAQWPLQDIVSQIVTWPARSNQSILKEISPGCSLEGLKLKLKLQYFVWPPHAKTWLIGKDWCWEGLRAGGEGHDIGWDGWMASPTWWTCVWVNSGSWWWTGKPGMLQFMGSQRANTSERLNWTELDLLATSDIKLDTSTFWEGWKPRSQCSHHSHFLFFSFKDFFWCGPFLNSLWICYSIVSVLCFGFLAPRHVGS